MASAPVAQEPVLREVVETLAPLTRRAGSPDERRAAEWLAERLRRTGWEARVEPEPFRDGYARQLLPLTVAAGLAGLAGRRAAATVAGALATAAIVDDASNGPRVWRRLVTRPKTTWNVVAEGGDADASRTLLLLAHHDAAPTGVVFDQSLQRALVERFPRLAERVHSSLPLWWPVAGAPALVAAGAVTGRRRLSRAGLAMCALSTALGVDVARNRIVPGANDNLSGVAALVALAERLLERPVEGLRVVIASCGAEEVLQGGIHGFAARHFPRLPVETTSVLNLDTVGSAGELLMLEGEGPFVIEDYPGPELRDLVAQAAADAGVPLRRGLRSRSSTDSVIPARAGYPTATIASWDDHKALSNYHLMSDTPENLDYGVVGQAATLAEAVARALAVRD